MSGVRARASRRERPPLVLLIHPAKLRWLRRAFGWRLKHGRVPSTSQFKCQVCGARAHIGHCRRAALERAEASIASLFEWTK